MLYIVNKNNLALNDCVERAEAEDVILLIEAAVSASISTSSSAVLSVIEKGVSVYVLMPDLQVRGITPDMCDERIQSVDYDGFVELVAHNNPIRSCF
ncbi:MAG: sulfur relay protein DsrH [Cycloclasticus sp. symbiont of Bathymodiolus heckerae]|nr:MAG: sulfur relay protein DsrH [Cycloclasticus sp. symbiont of Bathymodiolus heckerae]